MATNRKRPQLKLWGNDEKGAEEKFASEQRHDFI
jgi:hypothetical protein